MIYCIVMGMCAMFMFGIGLVQIKSKKPVAFYSGEKPPFEKNVKDIETWNWSYVKKKYKLKMTFSNRLSSC